MSPIKFFCMQIAGVSVALDLQDLYFIVRLSCKPLTKIWTLLLNL